MITFVEMHCGACGIEFRVPDYFHRECHARGADKTWYCPNGHPRVFRESESDKLRRERDRLKQQLAEKDDAIERERRWREQAERSASAQRGQVTKLRNRAKAGVCPCCNRQFANMARHMQTKHPDFTAEVLPIESAA